MVKVEQTGSGAVFDGATFRNADLSAAHLNKSSNLDCAYLADADTLLGAYLPSGYKEAISKQKQEKTAFLEPR